MAATHTHADAQSASEAGSAALAVADERDVTPPMQVAVIVVGYRNPADFVACLHALAEAVPTPSFDVFIAENGGPQAVEELLHVLREQPGAGADLPMPDLSLDPRVVRRSWRLQWHGPVGEPRFVVNLAEMAENLGYAGAVNAWLRPLLQVPGWEGAWILNPDAQPTPTALAELVACAARRGKGMVGSRIVDHLGAAQVHSRGLAWRKGLARTLAVDYHVPSSVTPDEADVEARLDAPSGASFYVTRALIDAIGLMDDRYFLYFEDLEWGVRAKPHGGVSYAHASIVVHPGGSTTRAGGTRKRPSKLTTYLGFRNSIHFVRAHYPRRVAWTVLLEALHALAFLRLGLPGTTLTALQGLWAGVRGEVGRPRRALGTWRPEFYSTD
jgi:N-acetylglucosaminyl-diphospho-decaprenol L-rhamnosyltransferase